MAARKKSTVAALNTLHNIISALSCPLVQGYTSKICRMYLHMSTFFLNSLQLILSLTLEMKSTSGNELASLLGLAASFSRRCIIGRLITYYTALDGQNWNYFFSHYDLISIEIQVSFLQNKFLINFACRFWFKWQIERVSVC